MQTAPPNKRFDTAYRQRWPRAAPAWERYERAAAHGDEAAVARAQKAYLAAVREDEKERAVAGAPVPAPPAPKTTCLCGTRLDLLGNAPERCPICDRRIHGVREQPM